MSLKIFASSLFIATLGIILGACTIVPKQPMEESYRFDFQIGEVTPYEENQPHFNDAQINNVAQLRVNHQYVIYRLNIDYSVIPREIRGFSREVITVSAPPCSNGYNWFLPVEVSEEDKSNGVLGRLVVLSTVGVTSTGNGYWSQTDWVIPLYPEKQLNDILQKPNPAKGPFC